MLKSWRGVYRLRVLLTIIMQRLPQVSLSIRESVASRHGLCIGKCGSIFDLADVWGDGCFTRAMTYANARGILRTPYIRPCAFQGLSHIKPCKDNCERVPATAPQTFSCLVAWLPHNQLTAGHKANSMHDVSDMRNERSRRTGERCLRLHVISEGLRCL